MAELTSGTIQLKNEYESKLSFYQAEKKKYEERVELTANAQRVIDAGPVYINGVTRYNEWIPLLESYKEIEARFKVNMELAEQDMIAAKNKYLESLKVENPSEYAKIKAAESRAAFVKKLPVIGGILLVIIILLIVAIKKGWFKKKK